MFLGLFDLELHYALYPPGAGYALHVDQPQGTAQRKVSLVPYLNPQWNEETLWGALRIYEAGAQHCDIEPVGGRLVRFCAGREHEVLLARRDRWSISGWYRGRD